MKANVVFDGVIIFIGLLMWLYACYAMALRLSPVGRVCSGDLAHKYPNKKNAPYMLLSGSLIYAYTIIIIITGTFAIFCSCVGLCKKCTTDGEDDEEDDEK